MILLMNSRRLRYLLGICISVILLLSSVGSVYIGNAEADSLPTGEKLPVSSSSSESNENCLMCHEDPDFKGYFEDGETISLFVDVIEYQRSVHEEAGLECVACHTDISTYPHHEEQITCQECHESEEGSAEDYVSLRVKLQYSDYREMALELNDACRSCHEQEFDVATDSAHMKALNSGNRDAPICIDCHGSHGITNPNRPRAKISQTCANCHKAVYSTYRASIHGDALENDSNPDVPTCVDCHGVHEVRGPRDIAFRNESINICGGCHSNSNLMDEYSISANVFETYLDDFHGRTVDQFRQWSNDMPSNKATCFDCHGIHNIRSPEDPASMVYPENLQHTCQQCHAEATIRFPDAWLSHYIPNEEELPLLYWVNVIYQWLIAGTIGAFVFYISLDVIRRWADKRRLVKTLFDEDDEDDFEFI
jgi:predicted CXXCH cytochrome family protein